MNREELESMGFKGKFELGGAFDTEEIEIAINKVTEICTALNTDEVFQAIGIGNYTTSDKVKYSAWKDGKTYIVSVIMDIHHHKYVISTGQDAILSQAVATAYMNAINYDGDFSMNKLQKIKESMEKLNWENVLACEEAELEML